MNTTMNTTNIFKAKTPTSFYASFVSKTTLLKPTLGILCVLSLSACQPTDGVSDDVSENEKSAINNADNPTLTPERLQTIETLAGVPMQQLASFDPQEVKQGGDTGISISSAESYSKPSSNLTASRKGHFFIGNAFFRQPWVIAPASTDSRDGLGALFNVAACQSCHVKDGRGHAPMTSDDDADSLLIRLAMPATTDEQRQQLQNSLIEKVVHPMYGGQLQDRGIQGVPAEARIAVQWTDKPVTFADGHVETLRAPTFNLTKPGYGAFDDDLMVSPRVALPMIGLGLLEQIPDEAIKKQAVDNKNSTNGDISGKFNWVMDPQTGKHALGRFGWKAGQTKLITQNQSAFNEDMGLTSNIRPHESCMPTQTACMNATTGADEQGNGKPPVEVNDEVAKFVEFYTRNLAVPHRRDADDTLVLAGKKRFYDMGCQSCHTPRYQLPKTDDDHLEQHGQVIYPYTDLLLHDMGDDLADRTIAGKLPAKNIQVEFLANSYEWRTPALWGIGLAQTVDPQATFLHDGRARTLMEAVLWHGGEAQKQQQKVLKLDKQGRSELNAFLQSL
ncbi:probable thiol oxidoreductase with 2 cytochrome c heme-binding sites [Psychrobacter sp. JCM 18903]|uniref:di-heme oxidoreductase family protein n=1 Tax=Psychrobacter sp. JCM 18903 TaxID=1298610 RepID=UPI000433A290|nr:di-heme oxidoredictase family protein [Psychrobacter sp. JCM 18903]GAF61626.1 probable thiol oxidoreductase with 2 cytochrome c heme-binding sites [Psychrobacter sp. JCM 18903]